MFVILAILILTAASASADPGWFAPDRAVGPARLFVTESDQETPLGSLEFTDGRFAATNDELGLTMSAASGHEPAAFVEITLSNARDEERNLSLALAFPLAPSADRFFAPAGSDPHRDLHPGDPPIKYGYRTSGARLAMPLAQVYSADEDWGLAFFGELSLLVESMRFDVARTAEATTVEVSLPLTLPPGESITRRIHIAATRGDWRPALAAILAVFPQAFEPQNPDVAELHGPFAGGGVRNDETIQLIHDQGCRVVEIHSWSPLYGEYVPVKDTWTVFCDDKWHRLKQKLAPEDLPADDAAWRELQAFVEQHHPPTMTVAKLNDYIERLHTHGVKGLMYFNPTEAWAPWVEDMFPDDCRRDSDGKARPVWYESSQMIPDKDRPWGKYLLDQIRGELELFPEVDGIFFDQSAGGGHDLTLLCAEGCRIIREQGKICWWNGPYNMELAALADGMMTEGGGTERYRANTEIIAYYGIGGKPIISLGPTAETGYAEVLIHGIIPKPVGPDNVLAQRWAPLFAWLKNRRWVLDAHALEVSGDIQANLFRLPDGNLVAPMVCDDYLAEEVTATLDVALTVRVPEVDRIRAAYLLTPDLLGYHRLDMQRDGDALTISVPRLGRAGLLVLATGGTFAALDGDLHVVRGATQTVHWTLDNWTEEPVRADLRLQSVSGEARTAAAWTSTQIECEVAVPADFADDRIVVDASARIGNEELAAAPELWVDDLLTVLADAPAELRDDETVSLRAHVLGHFDAATIVTVEAASEFFDLAPATREVALNPGEVASVEFAGAAVRAGEATIRVRATAEGATTETEASVQVVATAIAPGGFDKIRGADLRLDAFGVGGGRYEYKPIFVNGIEIGVVPSAGGDRWSAPLTVRLSPEAVAGLSETNEIVIHNEPGDAFKIRNLQLALHMAGGITVVSNVDEDVYTGWTDWLHGEGHQFAAGEPISGITLTVPVDPERTEVYEEVFGVAVSGRLVLEINGADGGPYAHKPVHVNGSNLGDLPTSGDWSEKSVDLTPEALAGLLRRNEVEIFNSPPPDAFKIRNARIEIVNADGERFVTGVETMPHTSVGWLHAEGKVAEHGQPIRFYLEFPAK